MTLKKVGRRGFLGLGALGLSAAALFRKSEAYAASKPLSLPVVISTWPFGVAANERAYARLLDGAPLLDAVIEGVGVVEQDPAVRTVGHGGLPNADGVVQLDACVMDGPTAGCGAVGCLEEIATPAAVARKVMELTPHILLVGAGAQAFALEQGFRRQNLLTDASRAHWEKWRAEQRPKAPTGAPSDGENHDTIGLLAVNGAGDVAGSCTTSGLFGKLPGRVGDSPLIGHGLYVDNDVGGASATGVGEEVIRICGSHTVVEEMRRGRSPQEACEEACRRIIDANRRRRSKNDVPPDAFIAVRTDGTIGACAVHEGYFRYALSRDGKTELLEAPGLLPPRK